MFRRILPGEGSFEWTDGSGQLHLVERPLPVEWAGRKITSMLPEGVRLVSVIRATAPSLQVDDLVGQDGDVLYLAVTDTTPAGLAELFSAGAGSRDGSRQERAPQVKVAVAGAGKVGRFLAEDLAESGHDVLLLEKDADLVKALSESLPPGVNCIAADACEVSSLHAARLDEADVVVAVTGDDEDNLVISLLSKQEFAVPRVIARVNHPRNHWLFNESWGVDVAVSTPQLLAGLVEEAVSVGVLVRLLQFEGGNTRLVEMTLGDGSSVRGSSVADLGLPRAPPSWRSCATATWSSRAPTPSSTSATS